MKAFLVENPRPRIEVVFDEMGIGQGQYTSKQVTSGRKVGRGDVARYAYPLSVEKCQEMRKNWGSLLKVHRDLGDWYREAFQVRAQHIGTAAQTDAKLANLPVAYPELNGYLFGDQRVTAKWVDQAYRGGGLLADEVGTGKTVGVLAGLLERVQNGPTLIVCPKISVKAVWGKEFAKHAPNVPVYLCQGMRRKREATIAAFQADPTHFKVLVVVSEMLRIKAERSKGRVTEFYGYEYPELFDTEWAACIVDESHKLMGSMDVVKGNLAGEGLKALSFTKDRLKLAVSATPFGKGGRVDAMFGTLHWLWPDEFPSRWAWLGKYFDITEERIPVRGGRGMMQTVKKIGELLDEKGLWNDLGPRVLRRTMEEVSPAHRGLKNFVEVLCEMDVKQRNQYKGFAQDAELAVDGGIITSVGVLDHMTRCRQFANGSLRAEGGRVVYTGESAKIERLVAHLEGLPVDRRVVVASQYNEFLDVVERRLAKEGYRWYRLDGKTTENARSIIMGEFQGDERYTGQQSEGELKTFTGPNVTCSDCNVSAGRKHGQRCPVNRPTVFLLNGQAGGVSITLDAAEELHALDEMYPPEANEQLFGRIFRRGRAHKVLFFLYRSIGTIDEKIGYNVAAGAEAQRQLLDGRRGRDIIRELAKYEEAL